MADEVKDHPGFQRRVLYGSVYVDNGYDIPAPELLAALTEALTKVPEAHRGNATVYGPDENDSDWGLKWWHYESDESYEHRWAKEQERIKTLHVKLKRDHDRYTKIMNGKGPTETKLRAAADLRYTRSLMAEVKCPLP